MFTLNSSVGKIHIEKQDMPFLHVISVEFRTLKMFSCPAEVQVEIHSVVDPGFSRGECGNSQKCYYFSIFLPKTA